MPFPYPLFRRWAGRSLLGAALLAVSTAHAQAVVSTLAGSGTAGNVDGPALQAQFNQPVGVALDAQGNAYVADRMNHAIRKISATGVVSTLAGNGAAQYFNNPVGTFASFHDPEYVLVTAQGNLLVADNGNGSIRQITPAGAVTTFAGTGQAGYADGPANTARFFGPIGLAQDAVGNVYVADTENYRIRKIDPAGNVTTLAGTGVRGHLDGPAATARFFEPQGIALDAAGNLYIADRAGNRIRRLTPAGMVSTHAGVATAGYLDGPAATARFNAPVGVAVDASGDVYVMERGNERLRRIEARTGLVSTVAGTGVTGYQDGPALNAEFSSPGGIAVHNGRLYVADLGNHRIRQVVGLPLPARLGAAVPAPQLEVFPNPVAGRATCRYYLPTAGRVSLTVYDILGRPVRVSQPDGWQTAGWQQMPLEAVGLAAGSYIARLTANGYTLTQAVLIAP